MANIFGKTVRDYEFLAAMSEAEFERHCEAATLAGYPLNFENQLGVAQRTTMWDSTEDQSSGYKWLTGNLQAMQTEVDETLFLSYRLRDLVPIRPNISSGADSYSYGIKSSAGEAGFLDNLGSNANSSTVSYSTVKTAIQRGGVVPFWSAKDVDAAMMNANMPLVEDTIVDGTMKCMKHIEKVAISGDPTEPGFEYGLINSDGALLSAAQKVKVVDATQTLSAVTDKLKYINGYVTALLEQSNGILGQRMVSGLTIYVPPAQYDILSSNVSATANANQSLMEILAKYNPWTARSNTPIVFRELVELKNASADGSHDRMVIAFNHPRVMEIGNSIEPRVSKIIEYEYKFTAPMIYAISALNFKIPKGALYVDKV